ncbi:Alpha/Beta hydrolase protein, partial [Chytriomyces sp. MP71]
MRLLWLVEIPLPWTPWGVETLVNIGVVISSIFLGALYLHQDKLIYMASLPAGSREVVANPGDAGMGDDWDSVSLRTEDGVAITGYAIYTRATPQEDNGNTLRNRTDKKGPVAKYTLLYCHANAGNMGHRLPIARILRLKSTVNVFMLSYRGYGKSQGSASEKGIKVDAQAALDWIASHEVLGSTKVILYGQSIGGAVAIDLASRNPDRVAAVIVENTFLSLPKLVPTVMPMLKHLVPFLLHQIWDSEKAIQGIPASVPMLFLSGGKDELIPQRHMIELAKVTRRARQASFPEGDKS